MCYTAEHEMSSKHDDDVQDLVPGSGCALLATDTGCATYCGAVRSNAQVFVHQHSVVRGCDSVASLDMVCIGPKCE